MLALKIFEMRESQTSLSLIQLIFKRNFKFAKPNLFHFNKKCIEILANQKFEIKKVCTFFMQTCISFLKLLDSLHSRAYAEKLITFL